MPSPQTHSRLIFHVLMTYNMSPCHQSVCAEEVAEIAVRDAVRKATDIQDAFSHVIEFSAFSNALRLVGRLAKHEQEHRRLPSVVISSKMEPVTQVPLFRPDNPIARATTGSN
jgi:hypothetical protein